MEAASKQADSHSVWLRPSIFCPLSQAAQKHTRGTRAKRTIHIRASHTIRIQGKTHDSYQGIHTTIRIQGKTHDSYQGIASAMPQVPQNQCRLQPLRASAAYSFMAIYQMASIPD
ncbi:MAG: hypothetical protein ABSA78_06180 [Candidatus Sulfotelmatobacter sp.]